MGRRPTKGGRRGGERDEDHENSFVSFIFSRSYGFKHSISGGTENVISKDVLAEGSYCHIKFPAIEERTLSWKRPVLKDPSESDIIDFYGPCDHDPLGKEEIQSQKRDLQRRFEREYSG